ncbi:DUF106 domain-containing protein [Candidatus Woesearchaeota archaeon]|nr:DUF106 domain-containing protein [Candidatus Woesearchaeota archaeon]
MSFITDNPLLFVVIISAIASFIVNLSYKYFTNQESLKKLRLETEELKKKIKEESKINKNDPGKIMEMQKRMFEMSLEQMKHTFKPMLINFIPLFFIFTWLRKSIPDSQVILTLPFNIPKVGLNSGFGWIGIYILSSLVFNQLFKKILKVYY